MTGKIALMPTAYPDERLQILSFTVPGTPRPHPRPRACVRGGHAAVYTPKPARDWKYLIQNYALDAMHGKPLFSGPVAAKITLLMPRPKGMIWKTKPMPREKHVKAGDCDNIAKGVLDAMNGVVYRDDRQVWCLVITKYIAAGDERPCTIISLEVEDCQTR